MMTLECPTYKIDDFSGGGGGSFFFDTEVQVQVRVGAVVGARIIILKMQKQHNDQTSLAPHRRTWHPVILNRQVLATARETSP